jgi:pyruvate kinase
VTELKLLISKVQEELKLPKRAVPVVAKIERPEALANLEEIVQVADIIMVARGDLGLETPISSLPVEQKTIIAAARRAAKPVIVATQLLYTMEHNPRPTRAEVSDVGNAVVDHADALLLTNETAMGEYPVQSIEMMRDTAYAMEQSTFVDHLRPEETLSVTSVQEVLSKISDTLASETKARLVLAYSKSGELARFLSHYRLSVPVVVGTTNPFVHAYSSVIWGLETLVVEEPKHFEDFVQTAIKKIVAARRLKKGDHVVVVSAEKFGAEVATLVEMREI